MKIIYSCYFLGSQHFGLQSVESRTFGRQAKGKHCQRHNGPEGWLHMTSSNTNIDQISSSESRLKNQFLNQTSASPINLKFKISTKHSFRIATKIQLHNLYKTSAAKCWTNSSFKILPELQNLDQTMCSTSEQTLASKSTTNCYQHDPHHQHQQQ